MDFHPDLEVALVMGPPEAEAAAHPAEATVLPGVALEDHEDGRTKGMVEVDTTMDAAVITMGKAEVVQWPLGLALE
jgi:hypothetical protein